MELKPCPFCGGCAELRESREEMPFSEECNIFYVICKKCGCSPFYFSEVNLYYKKDCVERAENLREKAIEAWNRRVDSGDVAPVRHGRWTDGDAYCPICRKNKFVGLDADVWADWKPDYCPNCGAKMDGVDDG